MSSLVITSTCQSQPAGYRPLDPRLDGVYAGYAGPSGWVNSGPQPGVMPKSAYYDATMTSQGYALNGNTYNQKLDLGTVGSGPTYGLLFVFELDVAPITSATARMDGVFSAPAVSSIGLGSVTSYISGETITIAGLTGSGNKRTSITEEVPVGPHVLCIHWNDSSAQYEIWLDGRAPAISTANGGVQLIDLVGSMFHGRGYAGDARPCPALVAVSRTPNVDLREYQGNPWALFEPRRIWVPVSAGGTNTYTFSVSGGASFSGASPLVKEKVQTPGGGIAFAGAPVISHERAIAASGQVTFSGTAPIVSTASYQFDVSGGVTFSGSPDVIKEKILPAAGGVNFGGSARLIFVPVGGTGNNDSDRISVGVSRKVGVS